MEMVVRLPRFRTERPRPHGGEHLAGDRGIFTVAQLMALPLTRATRHAPVPRLVSVEQTSNFGGGSCWSLEQVRAVTDVAHEHGLNAHCDGARLLNAVVATASPSTAGPISLRGA